MGRSVLVVLALSACVPRPPEVCTAAADVPEGQAFFTDVTAEIGLADVRGTRISTADFDGDGRPDILVTNGTSHTVHDGTNHHVWLLRNTGSGFEDVTYASGILSDREGGDTRSFQMGVWGDVDNDGDLDLFTGVFFDRNAQSTYTGQVNEILLNQGDGTFALATASEVNFGGSLTGASFTDVDRDGNLDLWLVSWYTRYGQMPSDQSRVFHGNGDGTFEDRTEGSGLEMIAGTANADFVEGRARRPAYGGTACDVDDDGDDDLLATVYGRQWSQLWMNDGGAYTDEASARGYAGDEGHDYSDNMFYRCYCEVNGCEVDPGESSLADCATYAGYWSPGWDDQPFRLNGNGFTTACADADNDGDLDLFNAGIVHWHIGSSSDPSELLVNDGTGHFTRPGNSTNGLSRPRSGSWNEGDIVAGFLDVDNDGWKDVLLGSSDYDGTTAHLFRQVSPGQYEDIAATAGVAHDRAVSAAVADFDGDGDQDVVFTSSTMRGGPWTSNEVHLYRNDLDGGAWSKIDLVGEAANKAGIGAKVTVTAGDLVQTFVVGGGYGHQGQQYTTSIHAGLADTCTIDSITVRWPDSDLTETTWKKVRASYAIKLHQDGTIEYPDAE